MSFFKVFEIAGSAMSTQSVRLNVIASNLANEGSISSNTEGTYRARQPVFSAVMDSLSDDDASVGVEVMGIVESKAPLRMEYAPNHPMANEDGYIFRPNVNVMEEMANLISASRTYQTNVEVMNTYKQMLLKTMTLGQ